MYNERDIRRNFNFGTMDGHDESKIGPKYGKREKSLVYTNISLSSLKL